MGTCGPVRLAERTRTYWGCDSAKISGDARKKSVAMDTKMHHFCQRLCVIVFPFPKNVFVYLFIYQFVSLPAGFLLEASLIRLISSDSFTENYWALTISQTALSGISFSLHELQKVITKNAAHTQHTVS